MENVSTPDFWEPIYGGDPPWDLGGPAPPFASFLARGAHLVPPARVAVLGSGRGHDALLFARAGFDVTGFDFARPAIEAATAAALAAGLSGRCRFERRDIFTVTGPFDAAVEHTCFCAIDPRRRGEYVETVRRIIRPGGLLVALFYPVDPAAAPEGGPDGPPFASRREAVERLFLSPTGPFDLIEAAVPADSIERRRGREWLAVLRRRP